MESSKMILTIENPNAEDDRTVLTPGKSLKIDGEGVGNLIFHFLRTAARPVDKDDHLVLAEVGNGVYGSGKQRPVAPSGQQEVCENDEKSVLQRELNQPVNHSRFLVSASIDMSLRCRDEFVTAACFNSDVPAPGHHDLDWSRILGARPLQFGVVTHFRHVHGRHRGHRKCEANLGIRYWFT